MYEKSAAVDDNSSGTTLKNLNGLVKSIENCPSCWPTGLFLYFKKTAGKIPIAEHFYRRYTNLIRCIKRVVIAQITSPPGFSSNRIRPIRNVSSKQRPRGENLVFLNVPVPSTPVGRIRVGVLFFKFSIRTPICSIHLLAFKHTRKTNYSSLSNMCWFFQNVHVSALAHFV